jgi:CubicO group peptidase (beta-lactamase class C family)
MSALVLLVVAAVVAGAVVWGVPRLRAVASVGASYKAKVLCSGIFVSGRTLESMLAADVSADSYRPMRLFHTAVDPGRRLVTCSLLGTARRTAVFRPGLGATLAAGVSPEVLASEVAASRSGSARAQAAPRLGAWPGGEPLAAPPRGLFADALALAFAEQNPARLRRTRAVVVVQDGRLVAERYAPGFGPDTPLPGWSMTKSVLNALVGILTGRGLLSLDDRSLLPEWSSPADPRSGISVEDLLRMRSGLEFSEVYSDMRADVTQMLFASPSTADRALAKPLSHTPGTVWQYSSGTSNILGRVCRRAVERAGEPWLAFPRAALFNRVGMDSAIIEPDAAGDFVFSSFMMATARDWARFGQLFLQDGIWNGARVLPEDWVRRSVAPTLQAPDACYGAGWWLRIPAELGGNTLAAREVPADAFFAIGHEGQVLTVVPSRRLVAVRLGLSIYIDAWDHAAFVASLLRAAP